MCSSPEYIAMRQAAADELRREGEERTAADEAHNARAAAHEAHLAELRRVGGQPPHPWQPNTESLFRGFC